MIEFRDAGFTKMKKKKVLYNKCISVEVLSNRGHMDDLWLLFFLLAFLEYASLAESESVSS